MTPHERAIWRAAQLETAATGNPLPPPPPGLAVLGVPGAVEGDQATRAAFFYGLGFGALVCGLGLGGGQGNTLALLIGAGSLIYGNSLSPVLDVTPRPELQSEIDRFREQIPWLR